MLHGELRNLGGCETFRVPKRMKLFPFQCFQTVSAPASGGETRTTRRERAKISSYGPFSSHFVRISNHLDQQRLPLGDYSIQLNQQRFPLGDYSNHLDQQRFPLGGYSNCLNQQRFPLGDYSKGGPPPPPACAATIRLELSDLNRFRHPQKIFF